MDKPLLRVDGLACYFDVSSPWLTRVLDGRPRQTLKAVDGVSFEVRRGETFALVGESGCGKSTIARVLAGIHRPTRGVIDFDGYDLGRLRSRAARRPIHRRLQMIFQDPYASLDPRWRAARIIAEPIRAHRLAQGGAAVRQRVDELLTQVGLDASDGRKFPHEFSGGQRQRVSIARALASAPDFLICDEPTSSLDVSVQAQILNLMRGLQRRLDLSYLFISHNLAVVYQMASRVGVMYLGRLVEVAPVERLFHRPLHPYTRLLLDTLPDLSMTGRARTPLTGEVASAIQPPPGCAFHPRCPFAEERCRVETPALMEADGGVVACHGVEEQRLLQPELVRTYR
jgi:peptide/nickel transport system ATP-binding protein